MAAAVCGEATRDRFRRRLRSGHPRAARPIRGFAQPNRVRVLRHHWLLAVVRTGMAVRPGRLSHAVPEARWHRRRGIPAGRRRIFLDVRCHGHRNAPAEGGHRTRLSRSGAACRHGGVGSEQVGMACVGGPGAGGRRLQDRGAGVRGTRSRRSTCQRANPEPLGWLPGGRCGHSRPRPFAGRAPDCR